MKNSTFANPEVFVGIAGPIGIDIDAISEEISQAFSSMGYSTESISITKLMTRYKADLCEISKDDYISVMNSKMDYANKLCEIRDSNDFLAKVAIEGIREARSSLLSSRPLEKGEIASSTVYIIRQLKRPDEVNLLRSVYGKQFILISGYGSEQDRRKRIFDNARFSLPVSVKKDVVDQKVTNLLERDHDENLPHGQHLRDTFHLADFFVDGIRRDIMRPALNRFVEALFGKLDVGPTKIEYGMYAAKTASLRSTDLSRQVGAAIFSGAGEIISQGCNEVPRAGGGSYWAGENPDYRDIKLGFDPNESIKRDVIRDFLERLSKSSLLSVNEKDVNKAAFVDQLIGRGKGDGPHFGCLKDALVNDLTEYGRVVHAEMSAICDAARTGFKIKDTTLFVTTFPCHNCTKHIISSGINIVYYLEPYPKSRAKELHQNEISVETVDDDKVCFLPFLGISPLIYRDIFEKSSRKTNGRARTWLSKSDRPDYYLSDSYPFYIERERLTVDTIDIQLVLPLS